jgi:hypothetical protein
MDKDEEPRITKEQDVNDSGQPIFRPPEKKSEPIKNYWAWIWIITIALAVLAWIFLYQYFSSHHAPYSAPLK